MDRATACNSRHVNGRGNYVLYWMTCYRRRYFNFALERAVFWATELRKPLLILEALACDYPWASERLHTSVMEGMHDNLGTFEHSPAAYYPYVEPSPGAGRAVFSSLAKRACLVVTDDFPAFVIPRWIETVATHADVLVEKVDSNGLYPMRATDRIFLTARSFRTYLKKSTPSFPVPDPLEGIDLPHMRKPNRLSRKLPPIPPCVPRDVRPVPRLKGGVNAARKNLRKFIRSDMKSSGLSPYLHFGHISSHEIYGEVTKARRRDSEHFLDELITWRELGFNMCALERDYDKYAALPGWARKTLASHARDKRPVIYTPDQLENADTHDAVWNASQDELITTGRIRNRLRMLWGKKILEWSATPQEALDVMIHLNNKYALDGRDPNSYSGIFWVLGRYDRPWGPERPIFGLVRYMSSASTAKKLKAESRNA